MHYKILGIAIAIVAIAGIALVFIVATSAIAESHEEAAFLSHMDGLCPQGGTLLEFETAAKWHGYEFLEIAIAEKTVSTDEVLSLCQVSREEVGDARQISKIISVRYFSSKRLDYFILFDKNGIYLSKSYRVVY